MAPSKAKSQKMSLGDFLGDQSLGSWADEMEDVPVARDGRSGYGERRAFSSASGFGSDRGYERSGGDRGYVSREQLPLPTKPPFTAHLGNLSYDVTETDVHDFFDGCAVTHVRIIEDKIERKPKGFGYVEFGTLDGLKKALDLSGAQLQGRNVKVTVAEPPKDRPDRSEPRVLDDWSRKGPLPDLPNQGNQGMGMRRASDRGGYKNFDNQSDAGSERGERSERRRPQFENDGGKPRDFNNWERKGPLSPAQSSGPPREGGRPPRNEGPRGERRQSPAWGEGTGRSQDQQPRPARTFSERPPPPERPPTQAELDNQWRARMRPDAPAKSPSTTPEASTPSSPAAKPATLSVRPKLNLQKRTVSEAEPNNPASASSDTKASPFGAARPVDTARKEAEVAERKERERKEAEDRTKEEKRKRDEAKAEKEKNTTEGSSSAAPEEEGDESAASAKDSKENGAQAPRAGYEILQRLKDDEANEDEDEEDANGNIVNDKQTKPKEITRDGPRRGGNQGSWRRGSGQQGAQSDKNTSSTSKELDSEGWSTVPKSTRGRGRGGARAVAS